MRISRCYFHLDEKKVKKIASEILWIRERHVTSAVEFTIFFQKLMKENSNQTRHLKKSKIRYAIMAVAVLAMKVRFWKKPKGISRDGTST